MTVSSGKESSNSPWHDLAIEIYKIFPLDSPNELLIGSKDLGNCVYDTCNILSNYWIGRDCLVVLVLLDKVRKEKNELRDLNSYFKCCVNDLKAASWGLKEIFICCRYRAKFELEMSDRPWFNREKGIQRFRETAELERICHLRLIYLPWEGPENTLWPRL